MKNFCNYLIILIFATIICGNEDVDNFIQKIPDDYCNRIISNNTECVVNNELGFVSVYDKFDDNNTLKMELTINNLEIFTLLGTNYTWRPYSYNWTKDAGIGKVQKLYNTAYAMNSNETLQRFGISAADVYVFTHFPDDFIIFEQDVNRTKVTEHFELEIFKEVNNNTLQSYENYTSVNLVMYEKSSINATVFKYLSKLKRLNFQFEKNTTFDLIDLRIDNLKEMNILIFESIGDNCTQYNKNNLLSNHNLTTFENLKNLTNVTLHNCIENPPLKLFKGLYNVTYIKLTGNNNLIEIPSRFFRDQTKLIILLLNNNNIESLDEDLFINNTELIELDLSSNRLYKLHINIFKKTTKIKKLNLADNEILILGNGFVSPLINLEEFTLGTLYHFSYLKLSDLNRMPLKIFNVENIELRDDNWNLISVCKPGPKCDSFKENRNANYCPMQCDCWINKDGWTFEVKCTNLDLEEMFEFTNPINGKVFLNIENNKFKSLPNASVVMGYRNVSRLRAAGNQIEELDKALIPPNIEYIDLRNNSLTQLSDNVLDFFANQSGSFKLNLSGNHWLCDCSSVQKIHRFLKSNRSTIVEDVRNIYCADPIFDKLLINYDYNEICKETPTTIILLSCAVVSLLFALICYIFRDSILMWLYEHDCCLRCISVEDLDQDKIFDVFLSYSSKDAEIIPDLVKQLEDGPYAFKVCFHERNWIGGGIIPDQISKSVQASKRILIILSPNFMDSNWGRMEFRLAYQASMEEKRRRLIVVMYKKVTNFESIDHEMKAYLRLNTYIKWDDPNFWKKLVYAMPHKEKSHCSINQIELQYV